jgi:DNA-binding IclR family transcriptional regulator
VHGAKEKAVRTSDKVLAILRLFSTQRPEWTVEEASAALDLAQTTAYEYFRSLVTAELLTATRQGRYAIGPAVFELDRLVRRSDPLLIAGEPLLQELALFAPSNLALLCRFYRMKVMCVAQHGSSLEGFKVSYERGRPMPLLRGAASKVILAHVERRKLSRFYEENPDDVAANGLGESWPEFRHALRDIREQPALVTHGELDRGLVGISAPVFDSDGAVLGSVSFVCPANEYDKQPGFAHALRIRIAEAGRSLTANLGLPHQKP